MSAARDLHALLGSRICHDLISPIGAIGNGVELLAMSPGGSRPEIALIAESVENANARIRFFRVAFGSATDDTPIGRGDVADILRDLTKSGRVGIDWTLDGAARRGDVKLAFLLILCLETAMPWGGTIIVSEDAGRWNIDARAEKLKIDPGLWELLANPAAKADLTAAQVQFALVPDTAAARGRAVACDISDTKIAISF